MKGFKVIYGEDYICIEYKGKEVLYWIEDEWLEDGNVVFSICHAVELAVSNPKELLKKLKSMPNYLESRGVKQGGGDKSYEQDRERSV